MNLEDSGLSKNEAKVYLELLQNKPLSASEIAKKTSLDRTLCYTVLENLINKGLASFKIINNKKIFQAESPKNLLNPIKEKEELIKKIISELEQIQIKLVSNYDVRIFEGKEGIRTVMNKIIESKKASSFGGTGRAFDLLYDLQAKVKNLNAKQLNVRILFSKKFKEHQINNISWVKTKYLDIESEVTTTIFEDKVAIHLIKEKPIIILITNKETAKSYLNHFEILWKEGKQN